MSEIELKLDFYQKLSKKLDKILAGEMSIESYSTEIKSKISKMLDDGVQCIHLLTEPDEMGYVNCVKCSYADNIHDNINGEDEYDFDAELEYEEGNIDEGELIWRTCGIG